MSDREHLLRARISSFRRQKENNTMALDLQALALRYPLFLHATPPHSQINPHGDAMTDANATNYANAQAPKAAGEKTKFPLDQWYVAGFSSELTDKPIARKFLNQPVVLFRNGNGQVAALEDRCCHRSLPLSCGTVEATGLRCGYHGLLYAPNGSCIEIPGQERIPAKAKVKSYSIVEKNHILWIWMPKADGTAPTHETPIYVHHDDPKYKFGTGHYHYHAPYQLIHDNLLDLSHLGYVHLKTIGGNAKQHMNAEVKVSQEGNTVRVVRLMPGTPPHRPTKPPGHLATLASAGRKSNLMSATCASGRVPQSRAPMPSTTQNAGDSTCADSTASLLRRTRLAITFGAWRATNTRTWRRRLTRSSNKPNTPLTKTVW